MTLQEIYNHLKAQGHESDKGTVHSYVEVYEEILAPYRETAKNILEIGLLSGASLRMWEQYFSGTVYGIDCDLKPIGGRYDLQPIIDEGTHNISIFDATDSSQWCSYFYRMKFDVIIEDAGHEVNQQLQIYNAAQSFLSPNGIYIIEDIQDVDATKEKFINIDVEKQVEIIDLRKNKGRYDDVLVVIK